MKQRGYRVCAAALIIVQLCMLGVFGASAETYEVELTDEQYEAVAGADGNASMQVMDVYDANGNWMGYLYIPGNDYNAPQQPTSVLDEWTTQQLIDELTATSAFNMIAFLNAAAPSSSEDPAVQEKTVKELINEMIARQVDEPKEEKAKREVIAQTQTDILSLIQSVNAQAEEKPEAQIHMPTEEALIKASLQQTAPSQEQAPEEAAPEMQPLSQSASVAVLVEAEADAGADTPEEEVPASSNLFLIGKTQKLPRFMAYLEAEKAQ